MTSLRWSRDWALFATWSDLVYAVVGLILCFLLILWWRQQTWAWFRVALGTFLGALLLSIASNRIFVVPPHLAGCPAACDGWGGFPLRYAAYRTTGVNEVGAADFALNVLLLWLLLLAASAAWRVIASILDVNARGRRWTVLFIVLFAIVPWALLPRILNPPQPTVTGEELRLANNARRAAEFTYGITGLWIHRLSLEDVQRDVPGETGVRNLVCLRGYTYFFVPWQRYLVTLDGSGATALGMTVRPLTGSCWPP